MPSAPPARYPSWVLAPSAFLGLVLDPIRLAVLGRAVVGPVDTASLAADLGVENRTVLKAVGRLRQARLLTDDLQLDRSVLRAMAAAARAAPPESPPITGPWTRAEGEVLARFFDGDRLLRIPSSPTKRLLVLERIALEFEPGVRYPEREVNLIINGFHPDHASVRRYLVDEGLLTREKGRYWRSGGRVGD